MKVHANAPLGPKGRPTMVERVVAQGWSLAAAAEAAGAFGDRDLTFIRDDDPGYAGLVIALTE